jgi:hypothetical protein
MSKEVKKAKEAIQKLTSKSSHTWAELANLSSEAILARYQISPAAIIRIKMKLQQMQASGYNGNKNNEALHWAKDWWQYNSSSRYCGFCKWEGMSLSTFATLPARLESNCI